jgi:hypothetical protein
MPGYAMVQPQPIKWVHATEVRPDPHGLVLTDAQREQWLVQGFVAVAVAPDVKVVLALPGVYFTLVIIHTKYPYMYRVAFQNLTSTSTPRWRGSGRRS